MDTSQFVAEEFAKELLGSRANDYMHVLATGNPGDARTSALFAAAMRAFQKIPPSDQAAMAAFFEVVISDTASIIFGVIDGSTSSENLNGEFLLSYEGSMASGNLQDDFWAIVDRRLGA